MSKTFCEYCEGWFEEDSAHWDEYGETGKCKTEDDHESSDDLIQGLNAIVEKLKNAFTGQGGCIKSAMRLLSEIDSLKRDVKSLEKERDDLHELFLRLFASMDCGSSSCRFKDFPNKVTSGMRTNGGCSCIWTHRDHTLVIDLTRLLKKLENI